MNSWLVAVAIAAVVVLLLVAAVPASAATPNPNSSTKKQSEKPLLTKPKPTEYRLGPEDRIMFIGDSSTFQGSTSAHGFVNVFEKKVQMVFPGVSVFNAAINFGTNAQILASLSEGTMLEHFKPTKVVMVSGTDQFAANKTETSLRVVRYEVESIMSKLMDLGIPFVFASSLPHGEQTDGSNPMEPLMEEFYAIAKLACPPFRAMHVDLYMPFAKFVEAVNVDNLPSSSVTYLGTVLNEAGHFFVAMELLAALGVSQEAVREEGVTILEEAQFKAQQRRVQIARTRDFEREAGFSVHSLQT